MFKKTIDFALSISICGACLFSHTAGAQQNPASAPKPSAHTSNKPLGEADANPQEFSMRDAERRVVRALARKRTWDGPSTGPHAASGKTIVFVAADLKNGGVAGVARGVEEATKAIGWTLRIMDGRGSAQERSNTLRQALAQSPSGIVLGGFDASEQDAALKEAAKRKIPVVGWHAGREATGVAGLFYNITTKAQDVAEITALYAVTESKSKAGVVIFTDSNYSVAIAKSDAMANIIRACKTCTLLSIEDSPLSEVSKRMPELTASLLQRFGAQWTYSLAINDLYFDYMGKTLAASPVGQKVINLSGGDGSESAYNRIRSNQYQGGTVPEPLNLHGWQAVDELNRAMAGQPPSGYSTPVHLVTPQTIIFDGGPNNSFDPGNGYREAYRQIWGR
jgi:ribose transport system substrate-binding protein